MAKKYETYLPKSPHYKKRQRLFKSMESKEQYYKHSIPPLAIGRTVQKIGFRTRYLGKTSKGDVYAIRDGGVEHGRVRVGKKAKKVDWWYIK